METEIWKSVKDYEGYYEVSNFGVVKRIKQKIQIGNRNVTFHSHILNPRDNGKGYLRVKLSKHDKPRMVMLHRIIAEAFITNPYNLKTVNHINGIKTDNGIENLEWCTHSENVNHAIRTGLRKFDNIERKKVKCTKTNLTFPTIRKAAKYLNVDRSYLAEKLNGKIYNNTTMILI